jgi:antitoxin FitA
MENAMAQLIVRKIEKDVKDRLQRRARRHGVSMEEEVRSILREAAFAPEEPRVGLGTQIANLFKGIPDNDEPLPELPREPFRPYDFERE